MTPKPVVVYGTVPYDDDGELTFIQEDNALSCARVWRAIRQAKTWGELFSMLESDELEALKDRLSWSEVETADDAMFDAADIPGRLDGDYPHAAHVHCSDWMPRQLQESFGKQAFSFVSGTWTQYPPVHEHAIATALRELGYEVRRDDALVFEACGY